MAQRKDLDTKLNEFQNLDYVSDRNRELFLDFIDYLITDDSISDRKVHKYISNFICELILRSFPSLNLIHIHGFVLYHFYLC